MSRPKRALAPLALRAALVLILGLCPCACSGAARQTPADRGAGYLNQVDAFVEQGRYTAALALIDERARLESDNYEHYLLRSTVFTAMHRDDLALADLDAALAVFVRTKRNFPPKEQNPRLAGIHKNYALACYLAERRAEGEAAQKYRELFTAHAALVKSLDQPTYLDLMTMIGQTPQPGQDDTGAQ
ncbi:MAG: hypothetical protein HQK81_12645 [Desulfovibrionaceae bacterium]|nr:hypothetical protein [Desulfovibrionaceae bacterium]MBF0514892.1 hypothetical protein [Desulfovibrionaceae bacterium]